MKIEKIKKAFTLVELLIVVAIIGILAGMLMPALSLVKNNVAKGQTETFLNALSNGLEIYNKEYGYFPNFLTQRDRINLANASYSEDLVKTLTGRTPEGDKLTNADKKDFNRNSIEFLSFSDKNLVQRNGSTKWNLVDSFGNPNIYISVDSDRNGKIKRGFPSTADGLTSSEFEEKVPNRNVGVSATVIAFTLKKDSEKADADYNSENVFSW